MNVKPLLSEQPVTTQNHKPSSELVEVIQRLTNKVNAQQVAIDSLTARLAAAGIP